MEIIGIAGAKGAGKDSTANFIVGHILTNMKLYNKFTMNDNGTLNITYAVDNGNRGISYNTDVLDFSRRDDVFMNFLCDLVWPHVKIYHFADSLKYLLANMFSMDINVLFGNQEQKESTSHIKWKNMIDLIPKQYRPTHKDRDAFMSNREVMQYFGDIMRHIDDMCFVNYTIDEINRENLPVCLIADVRREEEIDAINNIGGKVIYLTRCIDSNEKHNTELGLSKVDRSKFYLVIENDNMTIHEKNGVLSNAFKDKGLFV